MYTQASLLKDKLHLSYTNIVVCSQPRGFSPSMYHPVVPLTPRQGDHESVPSPSRPVVPYTLRQGDHETPRQHSVLWSPNLVGKNL